MKVYGTIEKNLSKNNFITLIFKKVNDFFIQEKINDFNFIFKKIELDPSIKILEIEEGKEFDDDFKEYVYGFSDSEGLIKCGQRTDLTDYLIDQLDNIDDRMIRWLVNPIFDILSVIL